MSPRGPGFSYTKERKERAERGGGGVGEEIVGADSGRDCMDE